jgi:hypothetical protein
MLERPVIQSRREVVLFAALAIAAPAFAGKPPQAKSARQTAAARVGIPLQIQLDQPGYVTVVIDDERGNRVRNLIAETRMAAGSNIIFWDGYDEGIRSDQGDLIRHRIPPGTYRVRGLTHDGIRMRYEFSVNAPGSPPWKTRDVAGGWLADHTPPADILFLPPGTAATGEQGAHGEFLVCSSSAEAGAEFVWLTEEGRRLNGFNTGFWGGMFLARDVGPKAVADHVAYTFISGERDPDNDTVEVRAFKRGGRNEQDVEPVIKIRFPHDSRRFKTLAEGYGSNGLAVHDGLVIFSFTQFDKLVFVDVRTKRVVGELKINEPRGLQFDERGGLFVVTGKSVKRFSLLPAEFRLQDETTVISDGLDDPRRVVLDQTGKLYVADWGRSHQVKVFSKEGTYLHAIGKPGGPQLGLYDERRMSHPSGMTFDSRGRLWLAEAEYTPKRLSVWKPGGEFERAFYGPPMYGGGGSIDPHDKTRFFYAEWFKNGGLEFALDWQHGASRPRAIYWRPERCPENVAGPAGQQAFHINGRTYLTNCYNGDLRFNQDRGMTIFRLDNDHIARPVCVIANVRDMNGMHGWSFKNKEAINKLWAGKDQSQILMIWSDSSGDQIAQPDEIQWTAIERPSGPGDAIGGPGLQPMVQSDLSVTTTHGTRIAAPQFDQRGTPVYDLRSISVVGRADVLRPAVLMDSLAVSTLDGPGLVDALLGSDAKGARRWRINSQREHVVPRAGELSALTRMLGPPVKPRAGEAGPLIAVNGEMGSIFLVTMDGLVIQDLGGDARLKPYWRFPDARRGMTIAGISFEQEHFHPTLSQLEEGSIYLVAGFDHSSILRLEGWETVRRRAFETVQVDSEALSELAVTKVVPDRKEARQVLEVEITGSSPSIDGALGDWPASTKWAKIGDGARGAIKVDKKWLYAAFQTGNTHLLEGGDGDYIYQFKRGAALDLMIGSGANADVNRKEAASGDVRLLVTTINGEARAVLFRARAEGAPERDRVTYQSPVGKVEFDQVLDVTSSIKLAQRPGNFEFRFPLNLLELNPRSGMEILGDLGILRGDGRQTIERIYWNNVDTVLVSDIPSEARLQPIHWGIWRFHQASLQQ